MPDLKGGCSQLLQKRLSKGVSSFKVKIYQWFNYISFLKNKYFDSGDYNMAKAKTAGGGKFLGQKPPLLIGQTGDTIATPETVPHKKLGTQTSKLAEAS